MIVLTLARKPILATLARTAQEHGTGVLNIDASRIAGVVQRAAGNTGFKVGREDGYVLGTGRSFSNAGRWPANVVFEHLAGCKGSICEGACPVQDLEAQAGEVQHLKNPNVKYGGTRNFTNSTSYHGSGKVEIRYFDGGGAGRYFKSFLPA